MFGVINREHSDHFKMRESQRNAGQHDDAKAIDRLDFKGDSEERHRRDRRQQDANYELEQTEGEQPLATRRAEVLRRRLPRR